MSHTKSKSSKIKEEEGREKENENIDNNSFNYNMDNTKTNLDINSLINPSVKVEKISHLLYDQDNNDKIINISKLDEDLISSDERNPKKTKRHHIDSDIKSFGDNTDNNMNPIINISNLDIPNLIPNQIESINKENKEKNEKNSNFDCNKQNDIKIILNINIDEGFKMKYKHKNCLKKIPFYCTIIILVIFLAFIAFFIFFIFKTFFNLY